MIQPGVYHLRLVDATTADGFLTTYNQGDMRSAIGADAAHVGFTGASGGLIAIQTVSNVPFSYTPPPWRHYAPVEPKERALELQDWVAAAIHASQSRAGVSPAHPFCSSQPIRFSR